MLSNVLLTLFIDLNEFTTNICNFVLFYDLQDNGQFQDDTVCCDVDIHSTSLCESIGRRSPTHIRRVRSATVRM